MDFFLIKKRVSFYLGRRGSCRARPCEDEGGGSPLTLEKILYFARQSLLVVCQFFANEVCELHIGIFLG